MRKAFEDHRPKGWIIDGGTLFSASDMALPARMDWPATELSKKSRNRLIKKEQVGTYPFAVNHRESIKGKVCHVRPDIS